MKMVWHEYKIYKLNHSISYYSVFKFSDIDCFALQKTGSEAGYVFHTQRGLKYKQK